MQSIVCVQEIINVTRRKWPWQ